MPPAGAMGLRDQEQHDRRRGHDAQDEEELAPAERPDATTPDRRGDRRLRREARLARLRHTAGTNWKYRGRSTSQSNIIARPIATTRSPPTSDTIRPCRTRKRTKVRERS